MEAIHCARYESPLGPLLLAASTKGLRALEFGGGGRLAREVDGIVWQEVPSKLRRYVSELKEYFGGERRAFSFPLDLHGTAFQLRCWLALLAIPYGETRTYADIARAVGEPRAFRAVGLANHRNPIAIVVPCHRVVASNGTLCGYGGGLEIKRKLLELEGALSGNQAA